MNTTPEERWWRQRGRRLQARLNAGWWLDAFLPTVAGVWLVMAGIILILRRLGAGLDFLIPVGLLAMGVSAGICYGLTRRRFESLGEVWVRIEATRAMHNRLTMAEEGRQPWPDPPATVRDGLRWQWQRTWPALLGAAVLAVAVLVPIRPEAVANAGPVEEPLAWQQMEEWLDALEEEEVIDPEPLQELREQIQQLRAQPADEWYRHSSLEAGDSLKEQTAASLRELQRHLEGARAAVEAAALRKGEDLSTADQDAWNNLMSQTLEGLRNQGFSIDPELLKKLEGIDPSSLRQLTDAEWKALQEALERGLEACKSCDGKGDGTNLVAVAAMCQAWGQGGITRGPGEAPLFMADRETQLNSATPEVLPTGDLSRAALGDTLAVGEREHEIDQTAFQGLQAAGAATHTGEGGDTVWKQPLTPDEQAVLEEYFQ